jgi:hypothetical protein
MAGFNPITEVLTPALCAGGERFDNGLVSGDCWMLRAKFSIDFALNAPHSTAHLSHPSEGAELRYSQ